MVGCQWCTYPSIHFFHRADTLKIMVGCLSCTCPSIHLFHCADTLKITVGCPTSTYPSYHTITCADSEDHGRLTAEHISRHSPVCWRRHSSEHGRLPAMHISRHSHKNLHTCKTPWSAWRKRWRMLKTSRVATKHRAKHCAKITLCRHHLGPSPLHPKKKRLSGLQSQKPGRTDRRTDT